VADLSRAEFIAEFGPNLKPGDHVSLIGPTGRGKSTLWGQVLPACSQFDTAIIMAPKGKDPAYAGLGHPTSQWPPRIGWEERLRIMLGAPERHRDTRPKVWRIEVPVRKPEDMGRLIDIYRRVLGMTYTRTENEKRSVMLVVDDSKFVCRDRSMMDAVVNGLMIGRSKKVSIINNFQRPGLGVPREGLDQITHAIIAKNRDRDTAKRLTEISGAVDPKELESVFGGLGYHEAVWVNGRTDEWFVIAAN
jgi:hypothetical protein